MNLMLKKSFSVMAFIIMTGALAVMAGVKEEKTVVYYTKAGDLKVKELKKGKDLIPVYFDQAVMKKNKGRVIEYYNIRLADDKKSAILEAKFIGVKGPDKAKNFLFYANPMKPEDFTDQKKKDHMGMDYVPVNAD